MRTLVRAYDRLPGAMAVVAGLVLVGIVTMIASDVALRTLGIGRGVPGVIEFTEYGLYAITMLGAAWALRLGAHVVVEILVDALPLSLRTVTWWFAQLVGLAVSLTLVYAGTLATWISYDGARLVFRTYIFPEWWMLAPLPIGALILAVEFLRGMAGGPPSKEHGSSPRSGGA